MSFFGSTVKETREALLGANGTSSGRARKDPETLKKEAIARIWISAALIAGAFALIFVNISPDIGKMLLGGIVGYWLR